jgi:NAD(P)H-dependent flavin oxidoreductase YrpB (nitropropane dioxygenase family)
LADLGLSIQVIAAPMSGGPTTPAMVIAAHSAGGLGFLATGYKTPEAVETDLRAVRGAGIPFGVNVFAPNPVPISAQRYAEYAPAPCSTTRTASASAGPTRRPRPDRPDPDTTRPMSSPGGPR